jgi:hypothetical protein
VETTLTLALPAGTYRAEWVDTKTGDVVKSERFAHQRGDKPLASPKFAADIGLRVVRRDS